MGQINKKAKGSGTDMRQEPIELRIRSSKKEGIIVTALLEKYHLQVCEDIGFAPVGLDEPYRIVVGNNPANFVDPWGLYRFKIFGQTIDVSVSGTFLPVNSSWDLGDNVSINGIFPPVSVGFGLDIQINPPSTCDEYFSPYVGLGKNLAIGSNVVNGKLHGLNISIGLSGGLPFGVVLPNAFSK